MERYEMTTDTPNDGQGRMDPVDAATIEEAIRMAVSAEEHGHKMYKEMAEKSSNPLAKSLLEELAADELAHCAWFKELGREAIGEPDPSVEIGCAPIEGRIKAAFAQFDEVSRAKADPDQLEVLKKAIALEKESYETYDELFKKSEGSTKEIFDKIRR